MRALGPVVEALVGLRCKLSDRIVIAAHIVRDNDVGRAKLRDRPPQKPLGFIGISPWLHQNIEHNTILKLHHNAVDRVLDFI